MDTNTYGLVIFLYVVIASLHGIIPRRCDVAKNLLYSCAITINTITTSGVLYYVMNCCSICDCYYIDYRYGEGIAGLICVALLVLFEVLQTKGGRIAIWCIMCVCAGMYTKYIDELRSDPIYKFVRMIITT